MKHVTVQFTFTVLHDKGTGSSVCQVLMCCSYCRLRATPRVMEIWRCQVPPLTLTLLDAMDVSNSTTTMSSRTTNISNATNWTR